MFPAVLKLLQIAIYEPLRYAVASPATAVPGDRGRGHDPWVMRPV